MSNLQPGILEDVPSMARYLTFDVAVDVQAGALRDALQRLHGVVDGDATVVGLGAPLLKALGANVDGLRVFPHHVGPGFETPSTPAALWLWLRGTDRGELFHRAAHLEKLLAPALACTAVADAFMHGGGRDLTGYEDGTENPKGDAGRAAAEVTGRGAGLDGGSFVAVQKWVHDFGAFRAMPRAEQDASVGRRLDTNEEIADAPPSAHVKRTAQESFTPAAFILRRSMPWTCGQEGGLMFVAFGKSLDAFEAQLKRMTGGEDGVHDALFRFTRPVSGACFWCPPMNAGKLDLRTLGDPFTRED